MSENCFWVSSIQGEKDGVEGVYEIINGKVYGPYDWIKGMGGRWIAFSDDKGKVWGFSAWKLDQKTLVAVVNDKEYGPYEDISPVLVDKNGKKWAFWARISDGNEIVLIDGVQYGPYKWVSPLFFSPDYTSWGFSAGKVIKSTLETVVLLNGKELVGKSWDLEKLPVCFDIRKWR